MNLLTLSLGKPFSALSYEEKMAIIERSRNNRIQRLAVTNRAKKKEKETVVKLQKQKAAPVKKPKLSREQLLALMEDFGMTEADLKGVKE